MRPVSGLNRPGIPTPTVDTGPCSVAKALPAATILAVTASEGSDHITPVPGMTATIMRRYGYPTAPPRRSWDRHGR